MGATTFTTSAKGSTAAAAFASAVETARQQYGNSGYTGTIAEKDSFVVLSATPVSADEVRARVNDLMDDPRVDDKWGPAGALPVDGGWVFFGWASE